MIWPWQRPAVEHRSSSLADQVVTALLASASGGGARPALATAALESCATLYASALSACELSGPSSVVRAFDATWRASVASSLIRSGQAVYIVGADPASGLALEPVGHWDVYGGPLVSSWVYRCERAGPSGTAWETHPAGGVLHLRWLVDPARPWAGVGSDAACERYGIAKRLARTAAVRGGERAGRRVFAGREIRAWRGCRPRRSRRRRSARATPGRHRQRERVNPPRADFMRS